MDAPINPDNVPATVEPVPHTREFMLRKFVIEFLKDRDAARAYRAIRPDVSKTTAVNQGIRWLRDPVVAAAVRAFDEEQLAYVQEQTRVTLSRTVARLGQIAFADPRQLVDEEGRPRTLDAIPDDLAAAISGVDLEQRFDKDGNETRTTKYRLLDRNRTLDMLMTHLNGYEKHQQAALDPLVALLKEMRRPAVPVVADDPDVIEVGGNPTSATVAEVEERQ